MKNMDKKPKREQFFLVLLMFAAVVTLFCLTGCGGAACETPDCGNVNAEGISGHGCSIPGCGGCLSSGSGCDSSCWAQSVKCVSGSVEDDTDDFKVCGCDIRYFGDGCLGCNQTEKYTYTGFMSGNIDNGSDSGCFCFSGSSEKKERYMGCVNGCFECNDSDYAGGEALSILEILTGVD